MPEQPSGFRFSQGFLTGKYRRIFGTGQTVRYLQDSGILRVRFSQVPLYIFLYILYCWPRWCIVYSGMGDANPAISPGWKWNEIKTISWKWNWNFLENGCKLTSSHWMSNIFDDRYASRYFLDSIKIVSIYWKSRHNSFTSIEKTSTLPERHTISAN